MTAALTIVPASGAVIAVESACRVAVTGAPSNDTDGSEIRYRIRARKAGLDDLLSHEFSTSFDSKHEWDNLIFPDDGTWTVTLRDTGDDSQVATASVVVV
jgi:hypothetical protein